MCRHFDATIIRRLFISHVCPHFSSSLSFSFLSSFECFSLQHLPKLQYLSHSAGLKKHLLADSNRFAYCLCAVAASFALWLFTYGFCRNGKQKHETNAKFISRCLCGSGNGLCTVSCIASICGIPICAPNALGNKQREQMRTTNMNGKGLSATNI